MGDTKPPHPATVQRRTAPHPATVQQRPPPHPATAIQQRTAPPAVQHRPPPPATAVQHRPPPHPATVQRRTAPHPATVVQRATRSASSGGTSGRRPQLGFEFETGNLILGAQVKVPIFDDGELRIEPDSSQQQKQYQGRNIELVLKESDDRAVAMRRLKAAVSFAEDLWSEKTKNGTLVTAEVGGRKLLRSTSFYVHDNTWLASPQVTHGVPLDRMGDYLRAAFERSSLHDNSADIVDEVLSWDIVAPDDRGVGLLTLFATYLLELREWRPQPSNIEGPKNAFVAMPRTSFRSMAISLGYTAEQRLTLRDGMRALGARIAKGLDVKVIPYPLPYGDEEAKHPEQVWIPLTIGAWIESIVADSHEITLEIEGPGRIKVESDEMSPPPLYRELTPRYSLGAMGMDGPFVLLEERAPNGLGSSNITIDQWPRFVDMMFDARDDLCP